MTTRLSACLPLVLLAACASEVEPAVVSIETAPHYHDPALLAEAFALPVAAVFARAGFESQENRSLCGMATTVNVVKSLGLTAPTQKSLIIGSISPLLGVELGGVTLDEAADIVRGATSKPVTVLRDLTLEEFRRHIQLTNDARVRYTVNFTRKPLFGRGGGHHSPIGGYLRERDLVFVLDVNAEYKPWLVSTERLFSAIDTVDSMSGKKRGLLRIEAGEQQAPSPVAAP